jgi:capsular exopolysaccharide synthesis family protein
MSRIYEALRRAELERSSPPFAHIRRDTDFAAVSEPESVIQTELSADPWHTRQYDWTPTVASLPALAERGACIEQFRALRSQLFLQRLHKNLKTILISSGMAQEGKSFVASNLAITLARNNEGRVLLIDADLRRSSLQATLGAPRSPGLAEYLRGTAELPQILQKCADHAQQGPGQFLKELTFIPAGECSEDAAELIGDRRLEQLIVKVSPRFDWIIVDAPPVLAVTDAVDLARAADAVILVARQAVTPYDVAQRALNAFSNSTVLGFVLNAATRMRGTGYYDSYYGPRKTSPDKRVRAER